MLFHFTITYRLGTKNMKADALSCYYQVSILGEVPEPILPSVVVVVPIIADR